MGSHCLLNSLRTGIWNSALRPTQHSWQSDLFKLEVPPHHSLPLTFPQSEAKSSPGAARTSPHLSHSPTCLLSFTHSHLLVITPSPERVPFGVGRRCLCIYPLVRVLLFWISAQLGPSLPLGLCSNIALLAQLSLMVLYKIVSPMSPFSRHFLS